MSRELANFAPILKYNGVMSIPGMTFAYMQKVFDYSDRAGCIYHDAMIVQICDGDYQFKPQNEHSRQYKDGVYLPNRDVMHYRLVENSDGVICMIQYTPEPKVGDRITQIHLVTTITAISMRRCYHGHVDCRFCDHRCYYNSMVVETDDPGVSYHTEFSLTSQLAQKELLSRYIKGINVSPNLAVKLKIAERLDILVRRGEMKEWKYDFSLYDLLTASSNYSTTIPQLLKWCKKLGLPSGSRLKKEQLRNQLLQHIGVNAYVPINEGNLQWPINDEIFDLVE